MIMCILNSFTIADIFTAISALATLGMAFIAFFTLRQNRKQLEAMKEQWLEDRKPIIEASLISPPYSFREYSLAIELANIGKTVAEDITIIFDEDFIKSYCNKSIEQHIRQICSQKYHLAPNERTFLTICAIKPDGNIKTLFGKQVSDSVLKKLEEINSNANIHVVCNYKGGEFNRTLSALDKRTFKYSTEEQLGDIAWQIQTTGSDIKHAVQCIDINHY